MKLATNAAQRGLTGKGVRGQAPNNYIHGATSNNDLIAQNSMRVVSFNGWFRPRIVLKRGLDEKV